MVTTHSKPRRIMLDPFTVVARLEHAQQPVHVRPCCRTGSPAASEPTRHLSRQLVLAAGEPRRSSPSGSCRRSGTTTPAASRLAFARSRRLSRPLRAELARRCSAACSSVGTAPRQSTAAVFSISLGNPTWWRAPNVSQQLTAFRYEGRAGAGLRIEQIARGTPRVRADAHHRACRCNGWRPTTWLPAGHALGQRRIGRRRRSGGELPIAAAAGSCSCSAKATGGVMYRNPGGGIHHDQPLRCAGVRPARTHRDRDAIDRQAQSRCGVRAYAAGVFSGDPVLSQRRHLRGRRGSVPVDVESVRAFGRARR